VIDPMTEHKTHQAPQFLDVAMIMLNNSGMGGAERRFAQVFAELRRRKVMVGLAVNESLLLKLQHGRTLDTQEHAAALLVLKEPIGRLIGGLMDWFRSRHTRGIGQAEACSGGSRWNRLWFALGKLDYVLASVSVGLWLRRHRPRVMHLVLGGAYVALPFQCLRGGPASVVSVVCPSLHEMVGAWPGVPLYRRALRKAVLVDALSQPIAEALIHEGVQPARIRISNGSCVNTERFRPTAQKRPWIVFCGRLISEKEPLLFVEACRIVRERLGERVQGLRFVLLGDGPLRQEVEQMVAGKGLAPWMTIGWSDQVESVLSEALIFASLQRTDNYPSQALLEAMACGTAVVATDVGLTARLVDPAVGRRVEPAADKIAEAVIDLLENPARTEAMGLRARDRVLREHSMEGYITYLEQIYLTCGLARGQRCTQSHKAG
jgi:glycosyltransferase involved in cell wall biosynthesis